ncbi:hypothetical protein K431DRAFT_311569 [Polychaeton citri CBS 116435]|uniref:Transcriptional regulatory protein RXT2 N-terminal domain-containing protein n=1 Tax=Polychaeton citri CBS 116435 TaxID=1314669 RepID=A0A9P4UR92_9PEZI|nr:hypothetical protein K431DRAFT_311569 [Polychaeton citri CBS 116435]
MAAQQIQIAETIRAMKLALKRHAYDSDSDESIYAHTNRGNKLKRKAVFVREGWLDSTGGTANKRKANLAGYSRNTVYTNPTLFDSDGEPYSPITSDDDDGDRAQGTRSRYARAASPLEENPYTEIHLEQLLRPLTSPAELPDHPSLSTPYKSAALTEMAATALDMARRERRTLARLRKLLARFRGDTEWAPCGSFDPGESDGEGDRLLDGDAAVETVSGSAVPSVATGESATGIDASGIPLVEVRPATQHGPNGEELAAMPPLEAMEGVEIADMASEDIGVSSGQLGGKLTNGNDHSGPDAADDDSSNTALGNPTMADVRKSIEPPNSENTSTSNGPTHSMTTRRKARSRTPPNYSPANNHSFPASRTSSSPASTSPTQIHPWFTAPHNTLPDRDLGLPTKEADDSRHLLNLYVQKSELMIRHLTVLSERLLKADRMRKLVYHSCRATAHLKREDGGKGGDVKWVTEMSDGEDWFDVQEAGLQSWELRDGYLEKGKDEVEDVNGTGEEEAARRGGRRRRVGRMN